MVEPSELSRFARQKGARGEREVRDILTVVFPKARRRACGEEVQGVALGRDLDGTPGLCVQVQLSARPTIEQKLREAIAAAEPGEQPVAFTRRSSSKQIAAGPWIVSMRAEDFVKLLALSRGASAVETTS